MLITGPTHRFRPNTLLTPAPLFRLVAALALLPPLLCASVATAKEREDLPPMLATPFRRAGETLIASPRDAHAIDAIVLRWHRPPRGQMRWLDPLLLPATKSDSVGTRMADDAVDALLAAAGKGFARWSGSTGDASGVLLRLSPVFAMAADTARVAITYELVSSWSHGPSWGQVFVLARADGGWRIDNRGGITVPDSQP
jgi:hypothetical protein